MPRSAAELLQDLRSAGLSIEIDGEKLGITPAGKVSAAIRDEVTRHRDALMTLLNGETTKAEPQPIPRTHQEIREAWAKLNAERERQAAVAEREAEKRWVREHFEAARQQWEWEDEQGRRRAAEDLAEIFGDRDAWKYRRGY